jgi:hypothetical protein
LAPPTGETGSGSWPTPDASVANDSESPDTWTARRERVKATRVNGNGMGTPLAMAVKLWPTATASDGMGSRRHGYMVSGNTGTTMLDAAVAWATPRARDWKGAGKDCLPGQATTAGRRDPKTAPPGACGLALNPRFVEALMGLPIDWTVSDFSETASCHSKERRLSCG